MADLAIMTRDMKGYLMSPSYLVTRDLYNKERELHLNPKSYQYGAVLVTMTTENKGWQLTLAFDKTHRLPRPNFSWAKKSISWLGLTLSAETTTHEVPDQVISDHLSEEEQLTKEVQ